MASGPSLQVIVEASGSEKAKAQLDNLTKSINGVGSASQHAAATASVAGGKIKSGFANAGTGALQLAYVMDDIQYGMRGVVNNIPSLVMGFGMGAGVAGALSIAAIAASQLWEKLGDGDSVEKAKKAADILKEAYAGLADTIKRRGEKAKEDAIRELEAMMSTSRASDEIRSIRDRIFELQTPDTVAGAEAKKARKLETASLYDTTEKARQNAIVAAAEKELAEATRGAAALQKQRNKLQERYVKDDEQTEKELAELRAKLTKFQYLSHVTMAAKIEEAKLMDEIQSKVKDREAKLGPASAALQESYKAVAEAQELVNEASRKVASARQNRAESEQILAAKMDLAIAEADEEIKKSKMSAEEKRAKRAERIEGLQGGILAASKRRDELKAELNQQAARFLNISPFEREKFVADISDRRLAKDPETQKLVDSIQEMTAKLDKLTKEMAVEQFTGAQ